MKLCCGKEVIFNGSQEICFICLKSYIHSEEEIIDEWERRGGDANAETRNMS